jgi:hypothetical protein
MNNSVMKSLVSRFIIFLLFFVALHWTMSPAMAQTAELESHPGYVDLDVIPASIQMEPSIEVHIKGAILRLAAAATEREDPELAEMLLGLRAIRVYGYSSDFWTDDVAADLEDLAARMAAELDDSGWDVMVRVRERDERVHVYLREMDAVIQGMMVMVVDAEEAVFVNITGTLDPDQVGRIGSKFRIDALEDIVPD